MNRAPEVWERAKIIFQISDLIYFWIPEEFWDGPEYLRKSLAKYTLTELGEILEMFQRALENIDSISLLTWNTKDQVNALMQSRLIIAWEISTRPELIEKLQAEIIKRKLPT